MPPFLQRLGPDRVRQWLPLATLVLLVALVGLLEPVFLQPTTLLELAGDTAVLFILATGVTFVIMLGGIDLSLQSMASLSSVIVALALPRFGYGAFAAALAAEGLKVGVVDADIYGFSIPRMLGVTHPPTQVDDMILPPIASDVKVISIGMFVPGNQPVVWRGPMLHRALQQFLGDVFWGDLDVLLLDLPPGTGDIAISIAQLIPNSEILVVTTPQQAAAEVAERAGSIAMQTHQRLVGVIENMSWLELPDGSRQELFGSGGGQTVADSLSRTVGADVPLLGQIPLDVSLREGSDHGDPAVVSNPDGPAAVALRGIARGLATRSRGLAGRSLGLTPTGR